MSNFNDKDFDDFGSEFDESFELDEGLENSGDGFTVEEDDDAASMFNEALNSSEADPSDEPKLNVSEVSEYPRVNPIESQPNNSQNNEVRATGATVSEEFRESSKNSLNIEESTVDVQAQNDTNNNGVSNQQPLRTSFPEDSNSSQNEERNYQVSQRDSGLNNNASDDLQQRPDELVNPQAPVQAAVQESADENINNNSSIASPSNSNISNNDSNNTNTPRITIPNNDSERRKVSTIINILDAYRKLTDDQKVFAGQFINGGKIIEDETNFVISVLNVDKMLARTIIALREAKSKDPVERAFYIIELNDDVLYALGSLVEVFTSKAINTKLSKTQYARELVSNIDALDATSMRFVEATETVLKVVEV